MNLLKNHVLELFAFTYYLVQVVSSQQEGIETLGGLVPQEYRGAACLDGSPPGFWMRNATSTASSTKYIIHAQGGGWCYNEKGCTQRSKSPLGSSKFWTRETTCYGSCNGILSSNSTTNPDFYNWNAIFLGYCDGTSFSGNLKGVHEGLYYRGRANLDAILDYLLVYRGLNKATDVIFTGGSAGGLTVYLQMDHVESRLPSGVKVVGLADAGWFLDHTNTKGQRIYPSAMEYLYNMSAATTNSRCQKALAAEESSWKCFFAQYVFDYIQTPMFITQGMYDSWQLNYILQLGCGSPTPAKSCKDRNQLDAFYQYGMDMNQSISSAIIAKRKVAGTSVGAFVSACIVHCETIYNEGEDRWNTWTIETSRGSKKPRQVFADWFFGNAKYGGVTIAIDKEPYPNNPSCPVWTTTRTTMPRFSMITGEQQLRDDSLLLASPGRDILLQYHS